MAYAHQMDDGKYIASRLTGNKKNYLQLELSETACIPKVIPFPEYPEDEGIHNVSSQDVLRQVQEGIQYYFEETGRLFHVAEIRFYESDDYADAVYGWLALKIFELADQQA